MNEREVIKNHYKKIGKKGGMAGKGKAKARTRAQASAAAKARWKKAGVQKDVFKR